MNSLLLRAGRDGARPVSASAHTVKSEPCYDLGRDTPVSWSEPHADAWIGLLETHRSLTRELEVKLRTEDGLTLSALDALSWLSAAKGRSLRLSALATRCWLSLSGISRLSDSLEARGLVERRAVDSDRRAVEAHLTDAGLELAQRGQATHFACVQRLFFERLSEAEAALLAEIFSRFPTTRE